MPMGGGSKSGGTQVNIIRYAGYIETAHMNIISNSESHGNAIRDASPYTTFIPVDFDDAIYGAGYTLASFPSLYDMYGKFIGGLDIEALFEQVLSQVANTETIQNLSLAHRDLLDDDIEQKVLPRFRAGMRDINSVMSSTFLMGEAVIEQGKVKAMSEYDAKIQYSLITVASNVFSQHLQWNQQAIARYLDIIKSAVSIKMEENKLNYSIKVENCLWPFTVMSHEIGIIGALQGAMSQTIKSNKGGGNDLGNTLGGAIGGALLGGMVAGPVGAVAGGLLGGLAGLFQ